ncbi:MAG: TRAP transporter substrate-binding protein [Xanthobacteraceae bacterium]|jgi:TRAP-type transport system periplasmic protein
MKLRIAGYQDARSVHTRAMRALEASLKTKLGDGIAVEFEENIATRGRKVTDLLDLVESGELDLCYFSSSYVTARVPTLGVFDIPFAMTDRNRTRTLLQGALGERLASDVAARTAYKVLGFWDNGPRHISNRLRAIRMPADCKGIRIRTLPSAGHHATYRALGMEPVTIDIRDFVEAIASEKVDAQENPLTNVRQFGLQKYHRHVTMTAHFHGIALLLCNAKMLDTCAPALRDALAQAASLATRAQWDFATEDERESRAALEAEGVAIVDLDDAGRAAFRAAVRPLAERQIEALPAELAALLNLA